MNKEREGAIKALQDLIIDMDAKTYEEWVKNHYELLIKLKNER